MRPKIDDRLSALTRQQIAALLLRAPRIAWIDEDLRLVQRYLRGGRTCAEYDRLGSWPRMCVDAVTKRDAAETLATDNRRRAR